VERAAAVEVVGVVVAVEEDFDLPADFDSEV